MLCLGHLVNDREDSSLCNMELSMMIRICNCGSDFCRWTQSTRLRNDATIYETNSMYRRYDLDCVEGTNNASELDSLMLQCIVYLFCIGLWDVSQM